MLFSGTRGSKRSGKRGKRFSISRTKVNVELVRQVMLRNRGLTVRMITVELDLNMISFGRVSLKILGMRKVCAKTFVNIAEWWSKATPQAEMSEDR